MKKIFLLLFISLLSSSLSAQVKKTTTKRPQTTVRKTTTVNTPKDGAHVSKLLASVTFNKEVTTTAGSSQSNISDLSSYKQEVVKAGIINTNYTTSSSNSNTSNSASSGGVVYPVVPQPVYNGGMYNGGYNNTNTTGGSTTQKDYHNHKCFKCSQSGIYTCPCHSVATFGNTRYHDCPNCGLKHQVGTRHTCRCNDCGGDGVK